MATEWTQDLSMDSASRADWERLSSASGSGWWRLTRESIPACVPATMRPKLDGGVMILSQSNSGSTVAVFSAERIDGRNLDIQPFGLYVHPTGAAPTMALNHHGGWVTRVTPLPSDFVAVTSACSTSSYFFANPPEEKTSGALSELSPGHQEAFQRIVAHLSSGSAT